MKIILFDWNGTLIDDIPIWYESVKEVFFTFNRQPPTIAEYFSELEGDYLEIYRSCGVTSSREDLNAIYEPLYEARVHEANLFSGVEKTLRTQQDHGTTMGIITAQKESLVSPLLSKFNLNQFLTYREYHALDKKTTIQRILEKERVDPQECCFVGDAPSDIRHGKRAGVATVALLSGYVPAYLLLNAEPDLCIFSIEELGEYS